MLSFAGADSADARLITDVWTAEFPDDLLPGGARRRDDRPGRGRIKAIGLGVDRLRTDNDLKRPSCT